MKFPVISQAALSPHRVIYRPWLEESALRQMAGLPDEAFDTLARLSSRICDDPYARLLRVAVTDDGRSRMAELGDTGFITFAVDEDARLIRVFDLVWIG
jgi:hypothetical protein